MFIPDTERFPVVNLATASRFPCTAAIGLSPASNQERSPIAPPIFKIMSCSLEYPTLLGVLYAGFPP